MKAEFSILPPNGCYLLRDKEIIKTQYQKTRLLSVSLT